MTASSHKIDTTFQSLSHPIRRSILKCVARRSHTVTELAELNPDISLNAISKHIKNLETANLISRHVEGRTHRIHLNPPPLQQASKEISYFRQFWENSLDALAKHLEENESPQTKPSSKRP